MDAIAVISVILLVWVLLLVMLVLRGIINVMDRGMKEEESREARVYILPYLFFWIIYDHTDDSVVVKLAYF